MLMQESGIFGLIMDNAPNLVFIKDGNGVFLYANKATLELFPPDQRDKVIGFTGTDPFTEAEAETFLAEDRLAFANGHSELVEDLVTHDGRRRVLHTRKTAFTAPDGRRLLLGVSDDITELAARETALTRANEQLQQFSAMAAHDFRSPLASFTCALDAVRMDKKTRLSERASSRLERVIEGIRHLSDALGSLLETARADAVHRAVAAAPCDMNLLLAEVRFNLDRALRQANGRLHANRLPTLAVNASLFRQLLQNLVENSIKYRGDKPLHVVVKYHATPDGHRLVVEDNGSGIAASESARVFALFDQGGRQGAGGVGLGLAMCRKIVALHHGRIAVDGAFRDGCRIVVDLPRLVAADVADVAVAADGLPAGETIPTATA